MREPIKVPTTIVCDADNTLWDTRSSFHNARVGLILALRRQKDTVECDFKEQLAAVSHMDQLLSHACGRCEHDFRRLCVSAWVYTHTRDVDTAMSTALDADTTHLPVAVKEAHREFQSCLAKSDVSLYPDAARFLDALAARRQAGEPLRLVLFTEGRRSRILRTLESLDLIRRNYFDTVVIEKKTKRSFERIRAKLAGPSADSRDLFVMIGDSIESDIRCANQAGFETVYKRTPFLANQEPQCKADWPTRVISLLDELTSNGLQKA